MNCNTTHYRANSSSVPGDPTDLTWARFSGARLGQTDLSDAGCDGAGFAGVDLRTAVLDRATFAGAELDGACLEGVVLPEGACFTKASLAGALLTGSSLPLAHLEGADLRGAKLAEVDWEGADLRGANLQDATFHLGSSRSGRVGSTLASEGTRTGFYTDDGLDKFRSPEDVRKANLRGAILEEANIGFVDFYLVDVRGARCSPAQIERLRACGAILGAHGVKHI